MSEEKQSNIPYFYLFMILIMLIFFAISSPIEKEDKKITPEKRTSTATKPPKNNSTDISFIMDSQKARKGKKLLHDILIAHNIVDQFYYEPSLFGEGTANPKLNISLPVGVWANLTTDQQAALEAYVSSEILTVWRTPFKYSVVKANSPAAIITKKNVKNMYFYDWEIIEGKITNNGRDILHEKTISTGEKWQGKDLSNFF